VGVVGAHLPGTLRDGRRRDLGDRASVCEGGSFTGDSEGYVKEGSGMGIFVCTDTNGGPWRGRSFTGNFRRKVRFCSFQKTLFTGESERYSKKPLETGNFLHRGSNGEPGGGFVY